jgi:hypothetical protein
MRNLTERLSKVPGDSGRVRRVNQLKRVESRLARTLGG